MEHLFSHWDKIEAGLNNRHIVLFLDYDGTLSPIAERPQRAVIPQATKKWLLRLSKTPQCKLAVISGRALKDIKKMVGISGIIYAGNHGLEISGPKIKFRSSVPLRYKATLRVIKDQLIARLSGIKGALLEDKGLALALHYRLVDKKYITQIKTIFHELTIIYAVRNKIKITSGKKVFEVRPPLKWDKGKVVLWLLARQRFFSRDKDILPIYIGDDLTDENAFRALRDRGITVFVGGPRDYCARYYLKDTKEVERLLSRIANYL